MENTIRITDEQFNILNHHKTLPLGGPMPKEGKSVSIKNRNTLKFDDILWMKDYKYYDRHASYKYRAIVLFDNGWGVSIINGDHTFGEYYEYEMAIYDSDGQMINPFGDLNYNEDMDEYFGDVLGHLSKDDVEKYLLKTSKAHIETFKIDWNE